jgi:hypothetical protein
MAATSIGGNVLGGGRCGHQRRRHGGSVGVRVSTTVVWRRRLLMAAMARVGDQGRRSTEAEGTGEVAESRSTTTPG